MLEFCEISEGGANMTVLEKAAMTIEMKPHRFSTGSVGFRGQGKVVEDGKRFQVQVIAVEIGSGNGKNKARSRKS
jgi:acyl-coenzyme A thioesterase PaaI-like protein